VTPPGPRQRWNESRSRGSDSDLDLILLRLRRRRVGRKRKPVALLLAGAALLLGIVAAGTAATVFALGPACDLSELKPVAIGQNTFVYAADGSLLGAIPAERNRQPVRLGRMSTWLKQATVAIEDRRFYEHGGLDPTGIVRAVWANIRARELVQGGSTITQQLVRNLYISRERTVKRKLKEACLAIKLNEKWSKRQILSTYLNQVYFGSLSYGAEAAAQTYFSRPARSLTLPQAAMLAGLIKAPSAYDPFVAPAQARVRRTQVLDAMLSHGNIDRAQHDWAVRQPLGLKPGKLYTTIREPYFFGYVRDQLIAEYGAETVRSGGLKVYTTIIPRYQRLAEQAIRQTLSERTDPAAALVSIEPCTRAGAVLDVLLEDLRHHRGDTVRDHALSLRPRPARARIDGAVGENDLADRGRLRAHAAGGDRRVAGGHVERRDRDRAETHGRDVRAANVEGGLHAQPLGHGRDLRRRHVEGQLGVDGVVRAESRTLDRAPAVVRRVVGLDTPPRAVVAVAVVDRPVGERS
jgi:hypothetical protein